MLRYPPAADFPVSWPSHLDNADVAAALFDRPDLTGTIAAGQHPGITSPDLAQATTDHLGRRVSHEPLARGISTTTTAPHASAATPATAISLSCC